MDKDEYEALMAELAEIGDARAALEASLKSASEQSLAALVDALKRGARPADVARKLHYTDGYVRKIGRKNGVEPDPRYADLKPPVRTKATPEAAVPTVTPFRAPELPVPQPTRRAELLALTADLTPEREAELVQLVYQRHDAWYNMTYRQGMSDKELVRRAVQDGKLTASDLRN